MRYTPVELRHVKIGRSTFGGYRKLETEKLLEDIADSFEEVWRDRGELTDKLEDVEKILAEVKQRLALLHLGEDLLDVFELVGQLTTVAPDLFEAVRDVLEELLGLELPVAAERRTADLDVPQLNWCVPHRSSLVQAPEDREHDPLEHDQCQDCDHRREVERAGGERQDAPPKPDVGLAHVVEEALDRLQGIRQLHPGRQDVRQDRQDVNADEHVHEQLDLTDGVEHHGAPFAPRAVFP